MSFDSFNLSNVIIKKKIIGNVSLLALIYFRNKKAGSKPVKRQDEKPKVSETTIKNSSNENTGAFSGIKKLAPEDYDYRNSDKSQFAHLKRETQLVEESEKDVKSTSYARRKIISNWGAYEEIHDVETPAKDFKSLLNVPISEGGHFVFKSEKNWAIEVNKYSDFFSLNVKKLATDINCIPFCEYIDIDEKYFTVCRGFDFFLDRCKFIKWNINFKISGFHWNQLFFQVDQLTRFHNLAEKSRSLAKFETSSQNVTLRSEKVLRDDSAERIINILSTEHKNEPEVEIEIPETDKNVENAEEDLDFLLSLKEPVQADQPRIAPPVNAIHVEGEMLVI